MRAVILEPYASGHRATYVRWIARAFAATGSDVAIVGDPELLEHEAVASAPGPFRDSTGSWRALAVPAPALSAAASPSIKALAAREMASWQWLRDAYRASQPSVHDLVVVPYLDYCFHAVALRGSPFGRAPWCGITMRTEFPAEAHDAAGSPSRALRSNLRLTLLRRILWLRRTRAIFSIDPRCRSLIDARSRRASWQRLRYLPDPAEMDAPLEQASARRYLGIEPDRNVVLLFGSVDLRKGLRELLQGVHALPNRRHWTVIVAGRQTAGATYLIEHWQSTTPGTSFTLRVINDHVDAALVPALFGAADVVWVGYPTHRAMSGVLVQAALAGRPVIAQHDTLIGDLVEAAGIGITCDVCVPGEVAAALRHVVQPEMAELAASRGPAAFGMHHPQEFGRRLVADATVTMP